MKSVCFVFAAGLLALVPVQAGNAPRMKPGAWEAVAETRLVQYPNLKPTVSRTRYCVTAEDAAKAEVDLGPTANCSMTKIKWSGNSYSAELVCPGPPASVNKISLTFHGPEHFTGSYDITIDTGGGLQSIAKVEGKRIGATCPTK